MPIVRLSRDKRGLDTLYLIDTRPDARRPGGARVLYFWTAPPGLRVGRMPLDAARQRELERRYPDVEFDWPDLERAAESARQQAAASTPEARREAWRGAARNAKAAPQRQPRSSTGGADAPRPRPHPAPAVDLEPVPALAAQADEDGDGTDTMRASSPGSEPREPADEASGASEAGGAPQGRRRRRRRPRRAEAADETPRAPDPIIE